MIQKEVEKQTQIIQAQQQTISLLKQVSLTQSKS